MTGHSVSRSNSVELAPGMPATWRANSQTAICMPRQIPRYGIRSLARDLRGADLALDAAAAEAAGDEDAVGAARGARARSSRSSVSESIQSISTRQPCVKPRVAQRLDDRQVGVLELDVLADERDPHRLVGRVGALDDRAPSSVRSGGAAPRGRSGRG